jgi:hypothetical protein
MTNMAETQLFDGVMKLCEVHNNLTVVIVNPKQDESPSIRVIDVASLEEISMYSLESELSHVTYPLIYDAISNDISKYINGRDIEDEIRSRELELANIKKELSVLRQENDSILSKNVLTCMKTNCSHTQLVEESTYVKNFYFDYDIWEEYESLYYRCNKCNNDTSYHKDTEEHNRFKFKSHLFKDVIQKHDD